MVTKVVTEHDVDNVTIIINPQTNKLEAKLPDTTPSEVVIEEVPNVTPNNTVVTLDGMERRITKLGKVNGTEWLVFQLEIPKPLIEKNIRVKFYDDVGTSSDGGITFNHTGKVRVVTADGSPFTPNGDSGYDSFMDSNLTMDFSGNTENLYSLNPIINFNTMTYSVDVSYRTAQTSSTLDGLSYMENVSFTAEHNEAIYKYYITSFSRDANTPSQPEPEQPPDEAQLPIETYVTYKCSHIMAQDGSYEMDSSISVTAYPSELRDKTPQTVKFDVRLGSQNRTYSYPYSSSNVYEWNSIGDFNFEDEAYLSIHNVRIEFTDGFIAPQGPGVTPSCFIDGRPE